MIINAKTLAQKRLLLESLLNQRNTQQNIENKSLYLDLKVNNVLHDEIFVDIDKFDTIFIKEHTLKYIASLLKEPYNQQFKIHINPQGLATLASLEQLGIKASYDTNDHTVSVFIPIEIKTATDISLTFKIEQKDDNNTILPAVVSGGANFYLNKNYYRSHGKDIQNNPFTLSSDLFLNIYDFVLESRLYYDDRTKKVQQGRTRLIKDDIARKLRYKLGYITLPVHNKQAQRNVFGVSVEKVFEIGGMNTQNFQRTNSHEFFIQNDSNVEIYVNGRYKTMMRLRAGSHNIHDFHLQTGLNNIKLKIIEDGGKIETISFNDFSYYEILKKGQIRYGMGMGFDSQQTFFKWDYDKDRKSTSGYLEYGLFDSLTLHAGIQKNADYLMQSTELYVGTNFGIFNPYIVTSSNNGIETGYKKGLNFRTNISALNFNFNYASIDKNYIDTNHYSLENNNTQESSLYSANIYTDIGMGVTMGASASSYTKNDFRENNYGLRFQKNFKNINLELNLERTEQSNKTYNDKIYLRFTYRFNQKYNVDYSSYINEKKHSIDLNYQSEGMYGLNSTLRLEQNNYGKGYNVRANLNDEKFAINTNYNSKISNENNIENDNLSVQLATGVAFVNTKATITAPVQSSFIIVDNDDTLEKPLSINNSKDDSFVYDSYTINQSDYSQREINIDESSLKFGTDLKTKNNTVKTHYKSGSIFNIEINNYYSIKGSFYNKDTKLPISKKAFKVFNTSTGEKSMSFTDEDGEFTIPQLGLGIYNITFVQERGYDDVAHYQFSILKESDESLINLGVIYLMTPKKMKSEKIFLIKK